MKIISAKIGQNAGIEKINPSWPLCGEASHRVAKTQHPAYPLDGCIIIGWIESITVGVRAGVIDMFVERIHRPQDRIAGQKIEQVFYRTIHFKMIVHLARYLE